MFGVVSVEILSVNSLSIAYIAKRFFPSFRRCRSTLKIDDIADDKLFSVGVPYTGTAVTTESSGNVLNFPLLDYANDLKAKLHYAIQLANQLAS